MCQIEETPERSVENESEWLAPSPHRPPGPRAAPEAAPERRPKPPAAAEPVEDEVTLARSYFDLRKFRSAARVLEDGCESPAAVFLRLYSLYMAGEKQKQEEEMETSEPLKRAQLVNAELHGIESELEAREAGGRADPHLRFLRGLVLKELGRAEEAARELCASVDEFPWNWSAWSALVSLTRSREMLDGLRLRDHWARQFFLVEAMLELHEERDTVGQVLDPLFDQLPGSTHLLAAAARSLYIVRDFDEAQRLFEELRAVEPFRLEGMDTYSNILYVKDAKGAMSFLAHNAVKTDKYQPETCCVVGNFYSLKGEHEKAVVYFKRALRLNPSFLSAWTLMGHEFVEMHRTAAAIEAYRRAIDINPRDYRAWYGLGQVYEILQMHTYSLYYFKRAADLKPYDARMWLAMAESFEALGRAADAIRCYHRSEGNDDAERVGVIKLARLYEKQGNKEMAAKYYRRVLEHKGDQMDDQDAIAALLFLAEYSRSTSELDLAEEYCNRLLDVGVSSVKEQAQSLLRDLRAIKQFEGSLKK